MLIHRVWSMRYSCKRNVVAGVESAVAVSPSMIELSSSAGTLPIWVTESALSAWCIFDLQLVRFLLFSS